MFNALPARIAGAVLLFLVAFIVLQMVGIVGNLHLGAVGVLLQAIGWLAIIVATYLALIFLGIVKFVLDILGLDID